jgi:hypothetical protein
MNHLTSKNALLQELSSRHKSLKCVVNTELVLAMLVYVESKFTSIHIACHSSASLQGCAGRVSLLNEGWRLTVLKGQSYTMLTNKVID